MDEEQFQATEPVQDERPVLRRIEDEELDPGLFPEEVHRFHEAGQRRQAHKAFKAVVKETPDQERRQRRQKYVEDWYLWLDPLAGGKAPPLSTLNGVGSMLYGRTKPNAHGHFLATLWFTFLYIPIVPIGGYLVSKTDKGYMFYAKTPISRGAKIWALGWVVLALAITGGLLGRAAWAGQRTHLYVYNGHDVAVTVQAGDDSLQVSPFGFLDLGLVPAKPTLFRASADGIPLEEIQLDLGPGKGDHTVYNVNRRAALVEDWVVYGPGGLPEPTILGSGSLHHFRDLDYPFQTPPTEKSVSEGSSITNNILWNLEDEGGFSNAVFWVSEDSPEGAAAMIDARLDAHSADTEALGLAMVVLAGNPDRAEALVQRALAAAPEDVEVHRFYQELHRWDDPQGIVDEYRALATEHADSAVYQYLYGRVCPDDDESTALFMRAVELDPELDYAYMALGHDEAMEGDYPAAARHYQKYASFGRFQADSVIESRLRLERLAAGSPFPEGCKAALDECRRAGVLDYRVGRLELLLEAEQHPERLAELVGRAEELGRTRGDEDPADIENYLAAEVALAAGDLSQAIQRYDQIGETDLSPAFVAALGLVLALSDGAPEKRLDKLLARRATDLTMADGGVLVLAAAAARATGHDNELFPPALEGLAAERYPVAVLDPDLDLDNVRAVDDALADVWLDQRGFGYAAAALMLEKQGGRDSNAWKTYRSRANDLLLPDTRPIWR